MSSRDGGAWSADATTGLGVHEQVVGVVLDGTPVAFPAEAARRALGAGDDGRVPSHQSFWFVWSQFHPDTLLWAP